MKTRGRQKNLWHHSNFLLLWGGQTVSQVGSQVTLWALPLVAVLTLKATPFQMGILAFIGRLPLLLIGLMAGVLADRISSRAILIVTDFGRAILIGSIPVAVLLHRLSLTQFYLVTFLVGCLSAFFDVAYQSFLPTLVEREQLVVANSRLEASNALAVLWDQALRALLSSSSLAQSLSWWMHSLFSCRPFLCCSYACVRLPALSGSSIDGCGMR
ncbi:MAG: MFS transporter [Ktedonobacteraceae bacterium]|nr:MFS transporter [Ktedonobacteraceae bacterium]